MISNIITCKNCGADIEITDAFAHQVEEGLIKKLESKHASELTDAVKAAESKAMDKLAKDFQLKLENATADAKEEKERNKALLEEIRKMNDEMRAMRRKDEEREIESQKKLKEEEAKIRDEASKAAMEKTQGEMAELKKQLEDTKKALSSADYKLSQTSQQLQGEVLELNIEQTLRDGFLDDEVMPIGKGAMGADIIHKVKGKSGKVAGVILWETKHAKWTPSWLPKLREDARNEDATVAVLVTANLPNDISDFQLREGVIVCAIKYVLPLASILRRSLLQIAVAKQTAATKEESLEQLFTYLQSETFRHRFEAFAEGVEVMRSDLAYERRVMERVWKKREGQIIKMSLNASRMYGELQGVMGNALPDIKLFALPDSGPLEESDGEV